MDFRNTPYTRGIRNNNPGNLEKRVSKALGISPTAPLTADSFTKDFYITIARAIAQIECHPDHTRIPDSSYQAAYDMIPLAKKSLKKK